MGERKRPLAVDGIGLPAVGPHHVRGIQRLAVLIEEQIGQLQRVQPGHAAGIVGNHIVFQNGRGRIDGQGLQDDGRVRQNVAARAIEAEARFRRPAGIDVDIQLQHGKLPENTGFRERRLMGRIPLHAAIQQPLQGLIVGIVAVDRRQMVGINADLAGVLKGKTGRFARIGVDQLECVLHIRARKVRLVGVDDHAGVDASLRHDLVAVACVAAVAGLRAVQLDESAVPHIAGAVRTIRAADALLREDFIPGTGVAVAVRGGVEHVAFALGGHRPAEVQGVPIEEVFVQLQSHAIPGYLHGIPNDGLLRLPAGRFAPEEPIEDAGGAHNGEGCADEQQRGGCNACRAAEPVSVFSLRMQHVHDLPSRPLLESCVGRNGIEELSVIILQHHSTSVSVSRDLNRSRPRFMRERTVAPFSPRSSAISSVESCS